jgi:hypothetical protein
MPQAIDLLLAMPVTRAFLPRRSRSMGNDAAGGAGVRSGDSPAAPGGGPGGMIRGMITGGRRGIAAQATPWRPWIACWRPDHPRPPASLAAVQGTGSCGSAAVASVWGVALRRNGRRSRPTVQEGPQVVPAFITNHIDELSRAWPNLIC